MAGLRIRERRREVGLKQNDLAARIGVSAAYLNLIERNKRPIGGALLARIARELSLPPEQIDGRAERRLRDELAELAAEPEIGIAGEDAEKAEEFIARFPAWAGAAAALHRRWRMARDEAEAMSDRLAHDPALAAAVHEMLTEITALRSTAEILTEGRALSPQQRKRFEQIVFEQSSRLAKTSAGLVAYFDDAAEQRSRLTPLGAAEGALMLAPDIAERIEQLATAARMKLAGEDIEAALARRTPRPPDIPPEAGRAERLDALAYAHAAQTQRIALFDMAETVIPPEEDKTHELRAFVEAELTRRLADALIAPAGRILALGEKLLWDVGALTRALDGDGALTMRRIACLEQLGAPRAAHVETDASGRVLGRRGALDLLPRNHRRLDCPVWPAHRAPQGAALALPLRAADGARLIAIAARRPDGMRADMLALDPDAAKTTAYAPALAAGADPIGPDCRICAHGDCRWRREPAVMG